MLERRQFLIASCAASALLPVTGVALMSPSPRLALYDPALAGAERFARSATQIGVASLPIEADPTRLWQTILRGFWQRRGAKLAGMTKLDHLFLLDLMARDAGQHLVVANRLISDAPQLLAQAAHRNQRIELPDLPGRKSPAFAWVIQNRYSELPS